MNTHSVVVKRVNELVKDKGIKIGTLATMSAIPPTTLKNIMYGNTKNPGIVTIKKICDGLGLKLGEFFDTDDFNNLEQEII